MAWVPLSFTFGQILTAAEMQSLQDNFGAVAAQNSGAPLVVFPNSGPYGPVTASFDVFNAASNATVGNNLAVGGTFQSSGRATVPDLIATGTASVAALSVAGALSAAQFQANSGFLSAAVSSLFHTLVSRLDVGSRLTFRGMNFPHFMVKFSTASGDNPGIHREVNVSCLEQSAEGRYYLHVTSPAFTNSNYFLMKMDGTHAPGTFTSPRIIRYLPDSSTLDRVAFAVEISTSGAENDLLSHATIMGIGN